MTFNLPLKITLAFLLSAFTTGMTNAASDNTKIIISYTYTPYVKLTGTAPGAGATRFYDNDELVNAIIPVPVNLGTMGLDSNVSGDCDLAFSTLNNFKLLHTVSNNNLGDYRILYQNQSFEANGNLQLTTACSTPPTDIDFILTGLVSVAGEDAFLAAGVYRDVVTITVTTQ